MDARALRGAAGGRRLNPFHSALTHAARSLMKMTATTPRSLNVDALTDDMNAIDTQHAKRRDAATHGDVVLITHADTDRGCRLACRLLARGVRVVAVARQTADLTRIMHGHSVFEVMTIAADVEDQRQLAAVLARAEARLGRVTTIVDGRGSTRASDLRNPVAASPDDCTRYLRPA